MHEAAHSLYTKRDIYANDIIGQAIEDARVHTLLRTQGSAKRDELYTALYDLRKGKELVGKPLAVVCALRSGAILKKNDSKYQHLLSRMCSQVGPQFQSAVAKALNLLSDGDQWKKAENIIRKAVEDTASPKSKPEPGPQPSPEKGEKGGKGEGL